MFYKVSDKELLSIRNKIVKDVVIPVLERSNFRRSPYKTSWYGEYDRNIKGYSYTLCRLSHDHLEFVEIIIVKGDRCIKVFLNIFKIEPPVKSLEELRNLEDIRFGIPPNSSTNMRLRNDDYNGPPIFYVNFMPEHKIRRYFTKRGFEKEIKKLSDLIEKDMYNINSSVKRWHELHTPNKTDWEGNIIA